MTFLCIIYDIFYFKIFAWSMRWINQFFKVPLFWVHYYFILLIQIDSKLFNKFTIIQLKRMSKFGMPNWLEAIFPLLLCCYSSFLHSPQPIERQRGLLNSDYLYVYIPTKVLIPSYSNLCFLQCLIHQFSKFPNTYTVDIVIIWTPRIGGKRVAQHGAV